MDVQEMFQEYKRSGGEIEEGPFLALVKKYKKVVDYYTFERIDYDNDYYKSLARDCVLALIQEHEKNERNLSELGTHGGVKSETVGKLRQEYVTLTMDERRRWETNFEKIIRGIISFYFAQTGLMYRGVTNEDKLRHHRI